MTTFERFWEEYSGLILCVFLLVVVAILLIWAGVNTKDDEGVCLKRGGVYAVTKRHYVSTGKGGYMHRHYECFVPAGHTP